MKKNSVKDARINTTKKLWIEYLINFSVLLCMTGGQALILYSFNDVYETITVPLSFIVANMGYWLLMSLPLTAVILWRRHHTHDVPLRTLSEAAQRVAEGDFSVHVPPQRHDGKKDNIEVLVDDFNTMVDRLASTEMLTNDFVANVSHEIRTPLSVIQSSAMTLLQSGISDEQKEYGDAIVMATKRLTALVSNILKLSKLENQKSPPSAEEYDLCRQLCECVIAFDGFYEAKGITLEVDMDDKAVIHADKSLLEIVWNNLLSNALKFTENGGAVTLTQTSSDGSVIISVADTGCGMSEETRERIFDKFYQGDTSHGSDGNGLGLALALRATKLADGEISVTSEPGKGSVFTVRLKAKK